MLLVGMFPTLFCIVDLGTSNGLMPSTRELMVLRNLLIMHSVEHAMQIIGVDFCLRVMSPRGSMMLQGVAQ